MQHENRVIWTEGMFLRPQHFQQTERWTERIHYQNLTMQPQYFWGVCDLEIDRSALVQGEFKLLQLRAILPDGSLIETPTDASLPLPLSLEPNSGHCSIYLALARRESCNKAFLHSTDDDKNALLQTRIIANEIELPDASGDIHLTAPINVGQYNLLLLCRRSIDTDTQVQTYCTLEIARVLDVNSDKSILIDEEFIPSSLSCRSTPYFVSFIKEISALISQRADALAERITNPEQLNLTETADFLFLSALNRAEPQLAHALAHASKTHPLDLFRICLQLVGDLAAFTKANKRPALLPTYNHDDLWNCFHTLANILRHNLGTVLENRITAINLVKKQFGLYIGILNKPSLLDDCACILAVQSTLSEEELRYRLPGQIKIGPIEEIVKLVKASIIGIPLQRLSTVPRQLPYQSATTYFELNQNNELWQCLRKSKAIAFHLAASFPELEMKIWLLKK